MLAEMLADFGGKHIPMLLVIGLAIFFGTVGAKIPQPNPDYAPREEGRPG